MESKPLIQLRNVALYHETESANDVKQLIYNTILGSPEGIRYRLLDTKKKLQEIDPLQFFPIRKDDNLLYVMALAERVTQYKEKVFNTYYIRYVTFNEKYATSEKKQDANSSSGRKLGNSFMKRAMQKHAENFPFSIPSEGADPEKKLYYAYVEESNFRSLDFTTFFFERIRTFSVLTFSRVFPKKDKRVSLVGANETGSVKQIISSTYKNYSFFFIEDEDIQNDYYVLREKGEIIAGVKVEKARWKIEQLPGFLGKILIRMLPYFPIFSRLIKPGVFEFLTFDTIFCSPGKEHVLPGLFQSVCAIKKVYSAMIYVDAQTELYRKLLKLKKMGILSKLFTDTKGAVLARFVNFSPEEKKYFYTSPVYLSGYDLS
jgi:hypothetical protein